MPEHERDEFDTDIEALQYRTQPQDGKEARKGFSVSDEFESKIGLRRELCLDER